MFIIFGERESRKRLGYVADYCPLCRDIHPATVTEVRKVSHLYYIPLGKGKLQSHERKCETCNDLAMVDPNRYQAFLHRRTTELEDLIAETNPNAEEQLIRQLELEERAAAGDATAEERFRLLCQPFIDINPAIEKRHGNVHLDSKSGFWLFMTFAAPWSLLVPGFKFFHTTAGQVYFWTGIGLAAGAGCMFLYALLTDTQRFIRRKRGRFLVESLVYLQPSREELKQVRLALRSANILAARKISLDWLYEELLASGMPAHADTVDTPTHSAADETRSAEIVSLPARFSS